MNPIQPPRYANNVQSTLDILSFDNNAQIDDGVLSYETQLLYQQDGISINNQTIVPLYSLRPLASSYNDHQARENMISPYANTFTFFTQQNNSSSFPRVVDLVQ
ncbi:1497_t:CDS:1, partial [Funneliformis mosseae]